MVRIDLAGRRVGGWVEAVDVEPPPGLPLRPLAKVRGWGPEPQVIDLAEWAAWRWASRQSFLLRDGIAGAGRYRPTGPGPSPPGRPAPHRAAGGPDLWPTGDRAAAARC